MIEIDGSVGEGGGQILRTSVSLSALTMTPVRVINIRAGRKQPGLRRQHMAGIELTGQLVSADISGLEIGSGEIEFSPRERRSGTFSHDVGTAGSISLILQAVLPPAILAQESVTLRLRGGTDVKWSPPIDYLREVFLHSLALMGPKVNLRQNLRGHYPKGGGKVECIVKPIQRFSPLRLEEFGKLKEVRGLSHCVRLPSHVAERQATAARKVLNEGGIEDFRIDTEYYPKHSDKHLGPGSGIVLWAESDRRVRLGADSLGERGKPAEKVGSEAAHKLLQETSTNAAVDSHLSDMLVPYLAIAEGESKITVAEVTSHLKTNVWVAQQIVGAKMVLEGKIGEPGKLIAEGIGLSSGQ
jgi:RNA 3'-phosphate cyclase